MNQQFFKENRSHVMDMMRDNSILFMFSAKPKHRSADQEYPYSPDRNFYYLTGIDLMNYALVITKKEGNCNETLFIPRPDPHTELFFGKMKDIEDYKQVGFGQVVYIERFQNQIERYMADWLINCETFEDVYLDLYKMRYDEQFDPMQSFAIELSKRYPSIRIRNIHKTICNLRRVKSIEEVELIKKAGLITMKGIEELLTHLRPGITENELAARFEFGIRVHGAKRTAFDTIASTGANTCVLHYNDYKDTVQDGDLFLIDLGAEYEYYAADISRTFPANGTFTKEQRYYYEAVLEAQKLVCQFMKPGVDINESERIVVEHLSAACLKSGLIDDASQIRKYVPHGVSHFLGLDVHDVGERGICQEGMVMTCEPGIYIPEKRIGIRIEDDMLITKDGCEFITSSFVKEVDEIEAFMRNAKKL